MRTAVFLSMLLMMSPAYTSNTFHTVKGWGKSRDEACSNANNQIPKKCEGGEIQVGEMKIQYYENSDVAYYCEIEYVCLKNK